ncbi:MAG: aldolase [Clostridiales bacterium]|nr:aldolase [Clostridiales bacterium]
MKLEQERELLTEYGRRMSRAGLSVGTSGNLSIYVPEEGLMAITPSGLDYEATTPADIVVMDLEAHVVEGERKPSSEWALHTKFYQRHPAARAVVHTHSMYCTTLACLGKPLEAVHYAIGAAGAARVPVAPYHLFGSPELAEAAVETCGDGKAVLLANHGLVAWEGSLPKAFSLARDLEFTAELQWRAMAVGTPNILTDSQMAEALERFKTYGQPKK